MSILKLGEQSEQYSKLLRVKILGTPPGRGSARLLKPEPEDAELTLSGVGAPNDGPMSPWQPWWQRAKLRSLSKDAQQADFTQ